MDLLRTHLITSRVYQEQVKKVDKRAKDDLARTTRNMSPFVSKDKNVQDSANMYRRAYAALRNLGYNDELRFKALENEDVQPFAMGFIDQKLGLSKEKISWIWHELNFVSTEDLAENFQKYAEECATPVRCDCPVADADYQLSRCTGSARGP